MRARPPSGPMRFTALAIFAGLPALFLILAAANLVSTNGVRDEIERQEKVLGELSARVHGLDPQGVSDTSVLYLSGNTPSLAAADLRRRIAAAVAAAGGRLMETRFVESDLPESRLDALSLGATFDIDNAGLARFLRGVETGLPIIGIRSLVLRRPGGGETTVDEDPLLRTDIVVEAFRLDEAQ